MRIFTIGYEAATMADFLAALTAAGVTRVIDVRALPLSRRPGFSKTPLKNALAEAGIDYVHLKALGTPAEGREADMAVARRLLSNPTAYSAALLPVSVQVGLQDLGSR